MKIKLEKMFSIFKTLPMTHLLCILVGILIFVAPLSSAFAANSKVTVMTRNLYLGADIFRVVNAAQHPKPENHGLDVPMAVADVYQIMLFTDFLARAEAIADEIASADPDVVGLNEVSTFYKQHPSDFFTTHPTQATTLVIDFYTVLKAALEARGMYYQAFSVTNADVELPMLTGFSGPTTPTFDDVRMVDHDYILVREDKVATQVFARNYAMNVGLQLGSVYVEFTRGYLAVDVNVKGEDYHIACTHPEVRSDTGSVYRFVQSAQMKELIVTLNTLSNSDPKPIIMVGDFNSSPEDVPGFYNHPLYGPLPYSPPYMQAVAAGYLDSWLLQNKKHDDGYTSGFDELVSDPDPTLLDTRIDLIFLKLLDLRVDRIKCDVVGNEVSDMVLSTDKIRYLWPSDHAGVVADMQFKVPK